MCIADEVSAKPVVSEGRFFQIFYFILSRACMMTSFCVLSDGFLYAQFELVFLLFTVLSSKQQIIPI